jgi:hypothetical protein
MANGRNKLKKGDSGRDSGGFIALPWSVLDCPAYASLSHPARSLLWEFARQYVRDNNGRLLASAAYLVKRGWRSPEVIVRAKRELLESGFIHETVKGHRPNKASWYAVTWRSLDKIPGYDSGAVETFERGAYRKNQPLKNASPHTSDVVESPLIATSGVVGSISIATSGVAIKAHLDTLSTTSDVHHLDTPSHAVRLTACMEGVHP